MIFHTDTPTKRWGAHSNRMSTGGEMVEKRTRTLHKCFKTTVSETCNPEIHKKYFKFTYLYPVGQQSCPIVSLENRG